jgi:hypothetical protein
MRTIFITLIIVLITLMSHILKAQAYNYSWMKGSTASSLAVYGNLGVASASSNPGSQNNGITWTDAQGNLWLYGGFGYTNSSTLLDLSDLWKYSPVTNNWTWVNGTGASSQTPVYGTLGVSASSNNPGSRSGSASWTDAFGNLWLFGGRVNGSFCNDLWRYTIASNQWTWMGGSNTPSQTAVYGSITVPSTSNIPGASYNFVSWKDVLGNFWLYDAIDGTEIWKYNPSTTQWAWMSGTNTGTVTTAYGTMGVSSATAHPGERWTEGVGDAAGNLYIFGGKDYTSATFTGRKNDLWKYEISNNQWTWMGGTQSTNSIGSYGTQGVYSTSNVPAGRYGHVLWIDGANKIWLFGGEFSTLGGLYWLNDTWCYNSANGQWSWMKGSSSPFANPAPVSGVVYGTQTFPAPANTPGWRVASTYWSGDPNGLWIFSGMEWTSSTELWKLNGCNSSVTLSVSSNQATLCPGATAILTATGSAGSYSWNTGAQTNTIAVSPLSTSVYSVIATSTVICASAASFTLPVQSNSLAISSSSTALCSGQSATLTVSGSATYTWSASQAGSVIVVASAATAIYSVIGAANGCTSSASYTQIVKPSPFLNISSSPTLTCSGNPVLVNASGAVSFNWNTGQTTASISISPISNTVYTVTGTTNGCSTTKSFTQGVLSLPTIQLKGPEDSICAGESVLLSALGANTYTWNSQGLTSPVIQVSPNLTTSYSVIGTDNNGCEGAAVITLTVSVCTYLREHSENEDRFSIYPNPASRLFTIVASAGETLEVINSLGQIVHKQKLESDSVLMTTHLAPGVYYCIMSVTHKIMKLVIQD